MANVANNGSKWIRKERRHAIYRRDNFSCVYCLSSVILGTGENSGGKALNTATLDHVVPGSNNKSSNLVTCCKLCNTLKSNSSLRKFATLLNEKGHDTSDLHNRVRKHLRRKITIIRN